MLSVHFQTMKKITTLLFLCFLLTGCGYTSPYADLSEYDANQNGTISIYVDMWNNRTAELGYQTVLKQSLVRWLKKSPKFSIAPERSQADYVLGGTVHSVHYPGLSYGLFNRAIELRAEVEVSFQLTDKKTGDSLIRSRKITRREAFRVGENAAEAESNKRRALIVIADSIADNIYIQIFYKFSRKDLTGVQDEIMPEDDVRDIDD